MSVQRFDLEMVRGAPGMEPWHNGEWVKFEDYDSVASKYAIAASDCDDMQADYRRVKAERDALQAEVERLRDVARLARAELVEAGVNQNCNYDDTLAAIDRCLGITPGDNE